MFLAAMMRLVREQGDFWRIVQDASDRTALEDYCPGAAEAGEETEEESALLHLLKLVS